MKRGEEQEAEKIVFIHVLQVFICFG